MRSEYTWLKHRHWARPDREYGDLKRRFVFLRARPGRLPSGYAHSRAGHQPGRGWRICSSQNQGGILGLFNMFSGGALSRFSDLRPGDHAVHLGLDHHAADVGGGPIARSR